jgi:hypothetical protein
LKPRRLALLAVAIGCRGAADPVAACEDYVAAAVTCVEQAYADDPSVADVVSRGFAGACEDLTSDFREANEAAVSQFSCYADEFRSGDCSSQQGFSAIDVSVCL